MTQEMVLDIGAQAIKTAAFLAGPMLLTAMVIGILISLFQAVTQINEQTLTFIPKIIGVALVIIMLAPWMLEVIQTYAIEVLGGAGDMIR